MSKRLAALHAATNKASVTYRHIAAEELARETPGTFDVVTCMEMLEHVPDPVQVVEACSTLLKPGGWAFFSTINRSPLSWLVAVFGAERVLKVLPRGTHDYAKFIKPAELKAVAAASGLKLCDEKGLRYNPITKVFGLGSWMGVNYLLAMRKV